jgi:hypothetical protein
MEVHLWEEHIWGCGRAGLNRLPRGWEGVGEALGVGVVRMKFLVDDEDPHRG